MEVTLDQTSGDLMGLALILSVNGNARQVLEVTLTRAIKVTQASKVVAQIVPMYRDGGGE